MCKIWNPAKPLSMEKWDRNRKVQVETMAKTQVGLAKDIASGSMKGFRAEGKGIAVSNIAGKFYAIGDRCTHRGCSLSKGRMEGDVVTCPCHGSKFSLKTGAVVKGPAAEPEPAYPVTVESGGIWVED
jgi:nitrite reductase/ring-hydroxylating ferredoxin subunit